MAAMQADPELAAALSAARSGTANPDLARLTAALAAAALQRRQFGRREFIHAGLDLAVELAGEALVRQYKVPEAQRFTNAFCTQCGGRVPRSTAGSGMVMVPMGSLDDDPGIEPQARIFQGSRAAWSCNDKALPGFDAMPG